MSVTTRQNRLLISQDWKKVYQSFRNADFQSYDFENLRRTMIDYIRTNYPEDFNDYIESSEYLALIDLIAFLGQSIAFRVDLNARENFLELAERRESVLRLARMISYNAKRNVPSQGLLKFTTVSTTESVLDSNGRNLSNQTISWNDSSNANWYDQFIKVINAALPQTQQFGKPANSGVVYGIPTEQYRFQTSNTNVPVYSFTKIVDGRSMNFEITSTVFSDKGYIYEEQPKLGNKLSFVYRNDGRGLGSGSSGFFLNFTEGTLNTGSFTITQPSNNQSVDIDTPNINNSDVWLYGLNSAGLETDLWTPVSNFKGNNIIYNSVNKSIRKIYSVVTRANDTISLQFSDGTFGDLPTGTFRTYYRTSNGLQYTINPRDINNVSVNINYFSAQGQQHTLTVTLGLTSSVSTSTTTESNESIKANAPATYYTQNRMITGEDYNVSPLAVSSQVAKIKSVNRSSSGVSRYFDLADPTGKYSSTKLFADDGVLYTEEYNAGMRFSYSNKTDIEGVIYNQVYEILKRPSLKNFYYANNISLITRSLNVAWNSVTSDTGMTTGYVGNVADGIIYKVGAFTPTDLKFIKPGALIKFTAPTGYYFDSLKSNILVTGSASKKGALDSIWAEVVSVIDDGTASGTGVLKTGFGPITLNKVVPTNAIITEVISPWRTTIDNSVVTTMIDLVFNNKPFGLRYDSSVQQWKIVFETNLDTVSNFSLGNAGDITGNQLDASWMLLFTTDNEFYTITSREQRYVFESENQIRFFFDETDRIYDSRTKKVIKDLISVLGINSRPDENSPYTVDYNWEIVSEFSGLDGYIDSKKIVISFADSDNNGVVDNPELFLDIVAPSVNSTTKYILQERYTIAEGQDDYRYVPNDDSKVIILDTEGSVGSKLKYSAGQYFYFVDKKVVKQLNSNRDSLIPSLNYRVLVGRDKLKFQYNHYANYDSRIDPGVSNIIDVFVLTKGYDTSFRQWVLNPTATKSLPPSSAEIYDVISPELNLIKSISDEVIYHPASYKILFGSMAEASLQASFKVVKNPNQVISDSDIKLQVVTAINQFFSLDNWDFGDTFYFTELATYVTNALSPNIANFVIVPRQEGLNFGSLFEVRAASDQLFISGATVNDIEVVTGLTPSSIKAITGTPSNIVNVTQQNVTSSPYGVMNG
jgi:hypothetical protein